jgi:hypothetical protein
LYRVWCGDAPDAGGTGHHHDVSGYEHHTLQCTGCNEIERRLVFTREKTPAANVPLPAHPAEPPPPIDRGAAAPSAWARTVAKLRGRPTDPAS